MGILTEAVSRLLKSLQISSASPGHINEVLQTDPGIDLDDPLQQIIEEAISKQQKDKKQVDREPARAEAINIKKQKSTDETIKKVKGFDSGNVGSIQRMSTEQFGNIKEMAANPFVFITRKVFGKFAKGAGIIALITLIRVAVTFIINELLQPGRFLDLRFKRDIEKEIIQFRRREDQQKLKQGFTNIIIVTGPGLRGGQGQTYNTLDGVRTNSLPQAIGLPNILLEASGVSTSKSKGSSRSSRATRYS